MRHDRPFRHRLRPLAIALLGLGTGTAFAQTAAAPAAAASAPSAAATPQPAPAGVATLPAVRARASAEPAGRDGVQATTTRIGRGAQDVRDLPQSLTVVTERLIDDRNLDTVKDALRNTSGVTFLAAEGGEEDIRLRGFPLQASGDVFVDGMRDPAFYERDTFFLDRLELLRGSASLLFGRGSTGGAVNQVTKQPRMLTGHQLDVTLGSHGYLRAVGDFNLRLGTSAGLRLGTMLTQAANNGTGTRLDKEGIAGTLGIGIGERHEWNVGLYWLDNHNGMNYGLPYIRPTTTSPASSSTLLPLDPAAYYGLASDRNAGSAGTLSLSHTWRLAPRTEWTTRVRKGRYERDQRASTIRFAGATQQPGQLPVSLQTFSDRTVLTRGTPLKIQDLETLYVQSDFSSRFTAWGLRHELLAGADYAGEHRRVYGALNAAQGGVVPAKPTTTVGNPGDGATVDESLRVLRLANFYRSDGVGVYLQDLVQVAPQWKLLLGLRHDQMSGRYTTLAIPNQAPGPVTETAYRMRINELSQRAAVLYQPGERLSLHLSAATSFNTSGDAYSLSTTNQSIPPEQAINVELGGRMDSADGQFTARFALFRSTKLHERNTDPLITNLVTLSGKRHSAGIELDLTGRLTPQWEVFGSYMWMPVAVIDIGAPGAEGQGTRPSLTPVHSGTIWTTWQATPVLRVGGGLNARSGQQPNRNPGFNVPRFVTLDLMAEAQLIPDRLSVKANLSNVTNKLYGDQLYTAHYIPGPGRLLQVTGSYRF